MIAGGINQLSFPVGLKIYLVVYLMLAGSWYIFLYLKLRRIDVATVALFTLLFPNAWAFNRVGFWAMIATLAAAITFSAVHYWPQYIKLFRDLNSIKE